MALVRIRMLPGGRVIWAKLSQAAKLVAGGLAELVEAEPSVAPETAALAPPEQAVLPRARPKRR